MDKTDAVSFAALLLLAFAIALSGGLLDPIIHSFNENQGAVMGFAALVTAGATVVLAILNRSSWKLYELERKRVRSTRVRIADRCRQAHSRVQRLRRRWAEFGDQAGQNPIQDALMFNWYIEQTQEMLDDLKPDVSAWSQECREPEATRWLVRARRTCDTARRSLPDEPGDWDRHPMEDWVEWIDAPLDLLEEELDWIVSHLEE